MVFIFMLNNLNIVININIKELLTTDAVKPVKNIYSISNNETII